MEEKKGGRERRNERETVMREQVTEVTSVSGASGDVEAELCTQTNINYV